MADESDDQKASGASPDRRRRASASAARRTVATIPSPTRPRRASASAVPDEVGNVDDALDAVEKFLRREADENRRLRASAEARLDIVKGGLEALDVAYPPEVVEAPKPVAGPRGNRAPPSRSMTLLCAQRGARCRTFGEFRVRIDPRGL